MYVLGEDGEGEQDRQLQSSAKAAATTTKPSRDIK